MRDRRLSCELLEARTLLAFSINDTPSTVAFNADNLSNSLILRVAGDRIEYNSNGLGFVPLAVARTNTITSFVVQGGAGADTFDASQLYASIEPLKHFAQGIIINGGSGNDTLIGSDLNDTLNGGTGQDSLFGGKGDDQLLAIDWEKDTLDGGLGNDSASFESVDSGPVNCEVWNPFTPAADNAKQKVKVMVLNYDPLIPAQGNRPLHEVFNWTDPAVIMAAYEEAFERTSGGFIDLEISQWRNLNAIPKKTDGFAYGADEYYNLWKSAGPWHTPDGVDYPKLLAENRVPELVDAGVVDEVWLFGAPHFGYWESAMAGPGAYFVNGGTYPEVPSSRAFVVHGGNYERFVDVLMHGTGHRTEATMQHFYGGWNLANPVTNWDKFSANAQQSNGLAGIGTAHYPANGQSDYDYANARIVQSNADDFLDYPNLDNITRPVNRESWGMLGGTEFYDGSDYQQDYFQWFYTRFPRGAGFNADGRANNWWKYVYDFNNYTVDGKALPLRVHETKAYDLLNLSGTTYTFTVAYAGATPIDIGTIDDFDVKVTGPLGQVLPAKLTAISDPTNGTYRVATYQFQAPGGAWDSSDMGRYAIALQSNQIKNTLGETISSQQLASFLVRDEKKSPLDNDAKTSLLLRLDSSLVGVNGEAPLSSNGVSYSDGVINQRAIFAPGGSATFPVQDNLSSTSGTVEFWIRPDWNASDTGPNDHRWFLTAGNFPNNFLNVYYDSWDDSVRLGLFGDNPNTSTVETDYGTMVSSGTVTWRANEWHHVGATWDSSLHEMAISVDGRRIGYRTDAATLSAFSTTSFKFGGENGQTGGNGFDEVRISTLARSAPEIASDYSQGLEFIQLSSLEPTVAIAVGDRKRLDFFAESSLGIQRDVSRQVLVTTNNSTILAIDSDGSFRGLASGSTTVEVKLGALSISIPVTVTDNNRPTVSSFIAGNVGVDGGTSHSFDITYSDNTSLNPNAFNNSDVLVQGPNGYGRFAQFVSTLCNANSSVCKATYRLTPPGGNWDQGDDGTYRLQLVDWQIKDSQIQFAASISIGQFDVNIQPALSFKSGILTINGSPQSDMITINSANGKLQHNLQLGGNLVSQWDMDSQRPDEQIFLLSDTLKVFINGGDGNDSLSTQGLPMISVLNGGTGDDVLIGGSANDTIKGDTGKDTLIGGAGNDLYLFDTDLALGSDTIEETEGGIDTLDFSSTTTRAIAVDLSSSATQVVNMGLSLKLNSNSSIENVVGGYLGDQLKGNALANTLTGGHGDDTLNGQGGNDTYSFDSDLALGSDVIVESAGGIDTLDFGKTTTRSVSVDLSLPVAQVVNAGLTLTLGSGTTMENITGGSLDDILKGNSLSNAIVGGLGNDTMIGRGNADTYIFDTDLALGSDSVDESGGGSDTLDFGQTTTRAVTVNLGVSTTQVINAGLSLAIGATNTIENVIGGSRNDIITGNTLNNTFTGGPGNDKLTGGLGNDVYLFDTDLSLGTDSLDESAGGIDTLDFSMTTTRSVELDMAVLNFQKVNDGLSLILGGTSRFEIAIGGSQADTLQGNDFANVIVGGPGNDIINGRGSNDVLIGGTEADIMNGGAGDDLLIGGTTSYDTNVSSLLIIRTTWSSSTDSYTTRVDKLRTGVGAVKLQAALPSATVFNDGAAIDSMVGSTERDWFFASLVDLLGDIGADEFKDLLS